MTHRDRAGDPPGRRGAAGAEAFTYLRQGTRVALSYWEAPSGAPWGAGALLPWAELGLEAGRRARAKRRHKTRRQKGRDR